MIRNSKNFILPLAIALALPVQAQELDEATRIELLEQQLEQQRAMIEQQQQALEAMQSELSRLKEARAEPVLTVPPGEVYGNEADVWVTGVVVEGDEEPDWRPGLEIAGFVNLDMIYDFDRVAPVWKSTLVPSTIPTTPGEFGGDGEFIFSIKQSQMAFKSYMETPLGDLMGWIEFDLFGTQADAGNTAFNLRHAYFELGNWGAGQTWTTFMDISTWPNVWDWWGPSGMVLNRNPMLRYTLPLDDRGSHFAVALEQQNGSFNAGIFAELDQELVMSLAAKSEVPDLIARWRMERDWGHLQVAGVARHLAFETLGSVDNRPRGTDFGWGFNVTGIVNVFGRDQIKYGLTFGEGIASFMNDGGGSNIVPELKGGVTREVALESIGYMLYYDHWWDDQWSSSIGISQNDNKLTNLQLTDQADKITYASTNLFYRPTDQLLVGIEALYGKLEQANGASGSDFRLQFTTRYSFDHRFSAN
ncbi:MAG: hypothetical protein HRU51_11850 [Xanthomonadales bacterium]|nr:hypothetical protein [Xanthomonadales bacterium]